MAYVPQTQENEDLNKGMGVLQPQVKVAPQAQAQIPQTPGQIQQPGQLTPGAIQPTMQNKQVGSGQFTNIKKYLQANQPAAQQMAQKVVGNVGAEAQKINASLNQGQQQLQQRLSTEQQRLQQGQEQAKQVIQQAAAGQAPQDQTQVQQFQNLMKGIGEYQNIQAPDTAKQELAAQNLQNLAQNVRSSAGQQQLLQQAVKGSNYTSGQKGLDQLLLGGNKENRQALIQGVQQQVVGLPEAVQSTRQKALEQLGGVQQQAQQTAKAVQEQYGAAQTGLKTDLENRLAAAGGTLANKVKTGGQLNLEDLNQLGIKPEDANLYGIDPNAYLQDVTLSGISTKEDLAKANALASLGGGQQNIISDLSQVGSYDPNNQLSKIKEAIASGKTTYDQAQQDLAAAQAQKENAINQWRNWTGTAESNLANSPGSNETSAKLKALYTSGQAQIDEANQRIKGLTANKLNVGEDVLAIKNKADAEKAAQAEAAIKASADREAADQKRRQDILRITRAIPHY